MARLRDKIGGPDKFNLVFITIDPARDTPRVVAEFTSAFSDDLLGLTGTDQQIATGSGAVGELGGDAGGRPAPAGEALAVDEGDAAPRGLATQGLVEVGAADRRGGRAVGFRTAQRQPGEPTAGSDANGALLPAPSRMGA